MLSVSESDPRIQTEKEKVICIFIRSIHSYVLSYDPNFVS
jgi:hypothetical protein